MADISQVCILLGAVALDLAIGDPRRLPHPIRWMGLAIDALEPRFRQWVSSPFLSGLLFAVCLVSSTWAVSKLVVLAAGAVHPLAAGVIQTLLIFYCLSARSLEKEAMAVMKCLGGEGIAAARARVRMIVGRETDRLDDTGVSRAAVETVAENLVDGFVSPLFFAAIGGAPLALAYKMVNTLDSMIGYRNETYLAFGKSAACIDDIANFIPARLSVAIIALATGILSGRWRRVVTTALTDGRHHSSPNAGYPEAAFAGALGVKLGGPNYYHGQRVDKPYIGGRFPDVIPLHIRRACELMILSAILWAITVGVVAAILN
jgi:adenosylcobinamide-phosphate synthase